MKKYLLILTLLSLTACFDKAVSVNLRRRDANAEQYQYLIKEINQDIDKSGHGRDGKTTLLGDHCLLTYQVSKISNAETLKAVIRYIISKHLKKHPGAFNFYNIKIIDA